MQVWQRRFLLLNIVLVTMASSLPQMTFAGDRRVVVGTQHMTITRKAHPYHHAPVVRQYPNTVIYSRRPRVIYQRVPTIVIASPFVTTRPFNGYRNVQRGWRNRGIRQGQPRYCPQNRRTPWSDYRGQRRRFR